MRGPSTPELRADGVHEGRAVGQGMFAGKAEKLKTVIGGTRVMLNHTSKRSRSYGFTQGRSHAAKP